MAKKLVHNYTFTPSTRQIALEYIYKPERLLMIVNATDNITLYQFNSSTLNYSSIDYDFNLEKTTITLTYDTTAMSSSDKLQIFVEEDSVTFQPEETFVDPVSKIRVSQPENLIDTDFEYGLQSQKWETLEQIKNIPTFFSRSGDISYDISAVNVLINSDVVTVELNEAHNLAKGSPVIIVGTRSFTCDGGYVATNIISSTVFQYKAKAQQNLSGSILDTYTQIFPGNVYQGTEFDLSGIEAITTDGASSSTLTVNTVYPTNFSIGTTFYLTNSISSVSVTFDAAQTKYQSYQTISATTANTDSGNADNEFALAAVQPYYYTGLTTVYFRNSAITVDTGLDEINLNRTLGSFEEGYYLYVKGDENTAVGGLIDNTIYRLAEAEPSILYDDFSSGVFDPALWAATTNIRLFDTFYPGSGSNPDPGIQVVFDRGTGSRFLQSVYTDLTNYTQLSFDYTQGGSFSERPSVVLQTLAGANIFLESAVADSFNLWSKRTYTIPEAYRTTNVRLLIQQVGADGDNVDRFAIDNVTFIRGASTIFEVYDLLDNRVDLTAAGTDGEVNNSAFIKVERAFDIQGDTLLFTAEDSTIVRNINIPVGTPVGILLPESSTGLATMPDLKSADSDIYFVESSTTNAITLETAPGVGRLAIPDNGEAWVVPLLALSDVNTIVFPSHGISNNSSVLFINRSGTRTPLSEGYYITEVLDPDTIRFKDNVTGATVNLAQTGSSDAVFTLISEIDDPDTDSLYIQSNNLNDGQALTYNPDGGIAITGLVDGGTYYVFQKSADRIKLSGIPEGWTSEIKTFSQTFPSPTGITEAGEIYIESHGFDTGDRIQYTSATPPTGITNGAWYYVVVTDPDRFRLYRDRLEAQSASGQYVSIGGTVTGTGAVRRADLIDLSVDDSTYGFTFGTDRLSPQSLIQGSGLTRITTGNFESVLGIPSVGTSIIASSVNSTEYVSLSEEALGPDSVFRSSVSSGQARFNHINRRTDGNLILVGTHNERTGSNYEICFISLNASTMARNWTKTIQVSAGEDFSIISVDFYDDFNVTVAGDVVISGTSYPYRLRFNIDSQTVVEFLQITNLTGHSMIAAKYRGITGISIYMTRLNTDLYTWRNTGGIPGSYCTRFSNILNLSALPETFEILEQFHPNTGRYLFSIDIPVTGNGVDSEQLWLYDAAYLQRYYANTRLIAGGTGTEVVTATDILGFSNSTPIYYKVGYTDSLGAGGTSGFLAVLDQNTSLSRSVSLGTTSDDRFYGCQFRNIPSGPLTIVGSTASDLASTPTSLDDFESGTLDPAKYSNTTGASIVTFGSGTGSTGRFVSNGSGTRYLSFNTGTSRNLTTTAQDMSGVVAVSFDYVYGNNINGGATPTTGEDIFVEASLDSVSWTVIGSTSRTSTWRTISIDVPTIFRTGATYLRFRQTASGTNTDTIGIDNIELNEENIARSGLILDVDIGSNAGNVLRSWKLESTTDIEFRSVQNTSISGVQYAFALGRTGNDIILLKTSQIFVEGQQILESTDVGAADGVYSISSVVDSDTFRLSSNIQINARPYEIDALTDVDLSRNAFYSPDHFFKTGTAVVYTTTGSVLGNLSAGATYYVITISRNWFKLATTFNNANNGVSVTVSSQGTGTHTFTTAAVTGEITGAGTLSIASGSTRITGSDTLFSAQFSPGDQIKLYQADTTSTKVIDSVNTATDTITVSDHGMSDGAPIYFTQDVYDLTADWIYYVNSSGTGTPADEFTVHATYADAIAGTNALDLDGASFSAADIIEHIDSLGSVTVGTIKYVNSQTDIILNAPVQQTFTDANYALGSSLLVRADGFALHRPYDGGVDLIPSANPDGQMIRQTRKYFRYQSGKGIQISMAINFSPTVQVESMTRSGSGDTSIATITTRNPHRLTVGRTVTVTGATVTSGTNTWNGTRTVLSVPDIFSFTIDMVSTPNQLSAGGLIDYYVNSWSNSLIKAGVFDDQNGLYFEYDGQNLYAVRRSSVLQISGYSSLQFKNGNVIGTGTKFSTQLSVNEKIVIKGQTYLITNIANDTQLSIMPSYRGVDSDRVIITKVVDTKIPQSSWNVDTCDGTGPTGYFLDIHKIQMAYIDYSWYGAGKARFGFKDQRGRVIYCHEFIHNNKQTEAYMRSGNLPARYEIENVGTPTYVPSLAHWGTSVIMDGRFDDDKAYVFTASSNAITITGASSVAITGRIETSQQYQILVGGRFYRAAGFGLLIPTSSAIFNQIVAGVSVVGANLQANTLTAIPSNSTILPQQPYQASVTSRIGSNNATQATRNLLILDRQPIGTAGGTSAYTATLSAAATPVVYDQPLISVRLAPSVDTGTPGPLGSREIINRMQLILNSVGILTTHSLEITLRLNGSINNNDWQRVSNPSIGQLIYHSSEDTITGGAIIYSFRAQGSSGSSARGQILTEAQLGEVATLGNSILGGDGIFPDGPDVLTVVARLVEDPSSVSAGNPLNISGRISWSESQA